MPDSILLSVVDLAWFPVVGSVLSVCETSRVLVERTCCILHVGALCGNSLYDSAFSPEVICLFNLGPWLLIRSSTSDDWIFSPFELSDRVACVVVGAYIMCEFIETEREAPELALRHSSVQPVNSSIFETRQNSDCLHIFACISRLLYSHLILCHTVTHSRCTYAIL